MPEKRDAPRAKKLTARDPRPSPAAWRAIDRYADASDAFTAACDERCGLARIDDRYADLVETARELARALVEDRRAGRPRWVSDRLDAILAERPEPNEPEADVQLAERALREARAMTTDESSGRRASS